MQWLDLNSLQAIILSVIVASTPLLLAASGELVAERAGVLNLGVEGMMIMGAVCAFAAAELTGSTLVGTLSPASWRAWRWRRSSPLLTLGLAVNQVATGLALTIFGLGLSGLIGAGFVGQRITPAPQLDLPVLTDLPFIGKILFGQDAFVYGSIAAGRSASGGSSIARGPGWCCAPSATTMARRMRSATRC